MERTWAAIDNGIITNTFVGGDDFADLVRPEHDDVVEITDLSPLPGLHWTVGPEGYRPPSPFPSWVWDVDYWRAPVPPPETGRHRWDEATVSWVEIITAGS